MKMLIQTVTYRGELVNRAIFKERNDGTFTPYKLSNEINNIEKFIWNNCLKSGMYYTTATLRDIFHFIIKLVQ